MSTALISANAEELSLQLWKWLTIHRKTRIGLIVIAVCTLCSFLNQQVALADGGSSGSINTFYLPVEKVTDSHGVPISAYNELPLDYGRATYPMRLIRGFILGAGWSLYVLANYLIISAVDFVLGMSWLEWLISPFTFLANTISGTVGKLFIVPTALLFSAVAAAFLWMRGSKGAAFAEVAVALVISAFIVSPAANPITYFAGDNGAIQKSVEYGNEVGNGITTDPRAEETNGGSAINASIIDVSLRTPVQVLSFGKTLDGKCAQTFDDKAKAGEKAEDIRKAVNGCDEEAKASNETDSLTALAFFAIFWVGFSGLWAIVMVMLFFILKDVFFALLNAINVIWRGVLAVFPWGTRYGFYNSFAQMWINIAAVGVCVMVTAIYLWLYGKLTEFTSGAIMIFQNFILGIIALVMAFTLFKMKRNGRTLGESLARTLSRFGQSREGQVRAPSTLGKTVKGFVRSGASRGGKVLARKGFIKAAPKVAASVATGGAAGALGAAATVVGGHIATGMMNEMGNRARANAMAKREAWNNMPASSPAGSYFRNPDGSIPMPGQNPHPENQSENPRAIEKVHNHAEAPKEPQKNTTPAPESPSAPAPSSSDTRTPSRAGTITPGRYQNVRVDKYGKPHTIPAQPVEGEVVDLPQSKVDKLKRLDSFESTAKTVTTKPRFARY